MISAIEHIAIAAKDTAALAGWYRDTLGFRVVVAGPPGGIWFVGPPDSAVLIEIIPAGEAPRAEAGTNDAGLHHLAFTVTNFDAVYQDLKGRGVRFRGDPVGAPGERQLAFFFDLEENILQIVQRPKPLGQ